jgi:hypothetical protein
MLRQTRRKRGGQRTEESCSNRYYNPTVVRLCARPNFNGKEKRRCINCPAHCHICKAVVWKYAIEQHYSTQPTSIDLPAHFMIGKPERAAIGKIQLLDSAAVPA